MVKDILSLEDSDMRNQYDSSITNFYLDFQLNPPPYTKVNSALKTVPTTLRSTIKT